MEHGFSILMIIFGGAILLYAALIAAGGYDMIPRNYATHVPDKKKYAKQFAKLLALVGLSPILGGLISFFNVWAGVTALMLGFIYSIKYGIQLTKIEDLTGMPDPDQQETERYWKRAERDAWDAAEQEINASPIAADSEDDAEHYDRHFLPPPEDANRMMRSGEDDSDE